MSRLRRAALLTAAAVAATAAITVLTPGAAFAHGALTSPASRTYACYTDGLTGGQIIPKNPACAAAVNAGGTQPLYDWYGVLRSDAGGRTAGYIPDGQLCSAGFSKYAAYDAPRADWPATTLQAGARMTMQYGAWVPHPGSFKLYVTRQGYDPTQPLKWSDLGDPFAVFDPQPALANGSYPLSVTLPNRSGRHIIYAVWWRSDSQESFYGCSDVVFNGTGGPTTPPTTTPPTTRPPTTPPATNPPTNPPGNAACSMAITVDSAWSGGFQATVTVTNNGTATMTNWRASFTMSTGTLASGWNGVFTQNGQTIAMLPPDYAQSIPPGGTATAGFLASSASTPVFGNFSCG
ncbi:lytic polysaccharide monooxygenase auxiliary activity family 9 protein [Rhizomonospora bruguierae]|uniref:lytic polysaccharide monooxygenase auxiliary activity family 9 protein n=1 Tax=Rhizomonospora bruguierae TaxID=1581705 RepID=UPI0035E4490D